MLKKSMLICSLMIALFTLATLQAAEIRLPARGTSMEGVVSQLGEPDKKLDAVGQPPITRWIYTNYSLYFENNLLLHAVENK